MPKDITALAVRPKAVSLLNVKIAITFFVLHFVSQVAIHLFGVKETFYQDFFVAINMDEEFNLAAFYSGFLLASISFLLGKLELSGPRKERSDWSLLSKIFLFLAIDEIFQIHELFVIPSLRDYVHLALTSIWVIPYGILSIGLLWRFRDFLRRLPEQTSRLFIAGGLVYVSGAIGMEMVSSYLVSSGAIRLSGFCYEALAGGEELLEMVGLIVFMHALLRELVLRNQKLELRFLLVGNKP